MTRHAPVIWAILFISPLCAAAAAAPTTQAATTQPTTSKPTDPTELTTADAVRRLPPDQAALKRPVRIRGTVTFISASPQLLFVQDATGGVCVSGPRERDVRPLRPGASVEIEGVTAPGRLVPVVVGRQREPVKITVLSEGPVPPAKPVSIADLARSDVHGDFVEIEGTVRAVHNEPTGGPATVEAMVVSIASGADRLDAAFLAWHGGANFPPNLVGSTVKVRGVFNIASTEKQQTAAMRLLFTGLRDLRIQEPAIPAFDLPVTTLPALKSLSPDDPLPTRARIDAVCTLAVPNKGLFVQSDDAGLWIESRAPALKPGQHIDVVGFPARRGQTLTFEDAVWKTQPDPAQLPDAPLITPDQALAGDFDARLVRIDALVLEVSRLSEGPTLVLQSGERVFLARVAAQSAADTRDTPRPNSWVQLTGVCVHNRLPDAETTNVPVNTPVSFHLLLSSPASIDVIHAPSWWTLQRVLAAGGLLAIVAIIAVAWVAALRIRVARQTSLIREHLARETLYEERVRIARELHDSLEQDLLGISMQLNATDKLLTQPQRARESLQLAAAMVRRSQVETHRAVWDLRDNNADPQGLPATLRQAITAIHPPPGTQLNVEVTGEPRPLPAATQNHLLRIALEAVTNALKHANAQRIDVRLAFTPDHLTLTIQDNGRGFDDQQLPPPTSGHFGLFGMRERAEKLKARLTVQSSPNQGTKIQLELPL